MVTVTSAWADWTGGTYTATTNENLGAITISADATLTINAGVIMTVSGGIIQRVTIRSTSARLIYIYNKVYYGLS